MANATRQDKARKAYVGQGTSVGFTTGQSVGLLRQNNNAGVVTGNLLQEDGTFILQEDGTSKIQVTQ